VIPDDAPPNRATIVTLSGRVDFVDGRAMDLRADGGDLDIAAQRLTLQGGVRVDTSDGYVLGADRVEVDLKGGGLAAVGAVWGAGPLGRIAATRLDVSPPAGDGDARTFLFQDDVRLVYHPAGSKEVEQ
jgi:lipopolysaccharide export system protein LptC